MNVSRKTTTKHDWHPADIKAALEKAGWSFSRIAREKGYARRSPANVLRIPWAPMELIVGEILDMGPQEIWPSRYDAHGQPLRRRGANVTNIR